MSIAAAPTGVGISFYDGATLADPQRLLEGNGKQNRFIRIPDIKMLRAADVRALISAAIAQSETPLPSTGAIRTVIQSVSAMQRPRRRTPQDS